jgi:hypothetical protein
MLRLTLLPLLLVATPAFADQMVCDGPFAANSSEAALVEAFGRDNVVTGEVDGPEGTTMLATTVFPNDPERRIEVGWWDEDNLSQLAYFTVPPGSSSPQGVAVGMSVAEVEALNGAPFEMMGFWWDYGGYANFIGGTLGTPEEGCIVSVRFAPQAEAPQGTDLEAVSGDVPVASTEPLLETLDVRVESLSVSYPDFDASED